MTEHIVYIFSEHGCRIQKGFWWQDVVPFTWGREQTQNL